MEPALCHLSKLACSISLAYLVILVGGFFLLLRDYNFLQDVAFIFFALYSKQDSCGQQISSKDNFGRNQNCSRCVQTSAFLAGFIRSSFMCVFLHVTLTSCLGHLNEKEDFCAPHLISASLFTPKAFGSTCHTGDTTKAIKCK